MNETKTFSKENGLEAKLLFRRAKSFEMIDKYEEAKIDLDHAISL